jgi:SAM-dependent methyltransferase
MAAQSRPPLTVRPRDGAWWRAQAAITRRFLRDPAWTTAPGPLLKSDLFDEASGPHHPLADAPAGFRLVGMDIDRGVVSQARARLSTDGPRAALVVADVGRLPFTTGAFALIISLSTLDHLSSEEHIAQAVAEAFRVLRPAGRLLLTLDNPWNPEVALRRALPRAIVSRLRADTFPLGVTLSGRRGRQVLERAGFVVEEQRYLVHAPRYPAIRILAWLDRLGRAGWAERVVHGLEALGHWPSRAITGHYVAWAARKPADPPPGSGPRRA